MEMAIYRHGVEHVRLGLGGVGVRVLYQAVIWV